MGKRDDDTNSDTHEKGLRGLGSMAQSRALEGVREASAMLQSGNLVSTTGPLAELAAADRRGILDEVRRTLIAKKAKGVVFEAVTVANLQEASERFGLELSAQLAKMPNNPRTDVIIQWQQTEIELQLKAGTDRYLKAAIRAKEDGTILLIPHDAGGQPWSSGAHSGLQFDGVTIESPTRAELQERSELALNRLSRDQSAVDLIGVAKHSLCNALIDGLVVTSIDLALQLLSKPDGPIDWERTAKLVLKTTATSAASSFLAAAGTSAVYSSGTRIIDASGYLRASRVASCVVPHAIDIAFDCVDLHQGKISRSQLGRRAARHIGAAAAEYFTFRLLARLACRLGPIGGFIVMIGGGLLASFLGGKLGELVYDLLGDALFAVDHEKELPPATSIIDVSSHVEELSVELREETNRRTRLSEQRLCEEHGCGRIHHARGMCGRHYMRWWRKNRWYIADLKRQEQLREAILTTSDE